MHLENIVPLRSTKESLLEAVKQIGRELLREKGSVPGPLPPREAVDTGGVGSPPRQLARTPRGGAVSLEPLSCSSGRWTLGAAAASGTAAAPP